MKYIAKQVPPEYQDSPLNWYSWPETIAVFGNRHYQEHISDNIARVRDVLEDMLSDLDDIALAADDEDCVSAFDNPYEVVRYYLWDDLSDETCEKVFTLMHDYGFGGDRDIGALCNILSAVYGGRFEFGEIHGCCQGDWQNVIYNSDELSDDDIQRFEMDYFNTGSEWQIINAENEDDNYFTYCYSWNGDDLRKELADIACCQPEEITMYSFDGWTREPKYKIA